MRRVRLRTITGRGFQPGEVVRVKIHEDPHTPQERGFDATADAEGNFSGEYLVMDYDLDMKFIVGARGLTSGANSADDIDRCEPADHHRSGSNERHGHSGRNRQLRQVKHCRGW